MLDVDAAAMARCSAAMAAATAGATDTAMPSAPDADSAAAGKGLKEPSRVSR